MKLSQCFESALWPSQMLLLLGVMVSTIWMFRAYRLTVWQAFLVTLGVKRLILGATEKRARILFGAVFFSSLAIAYFQCAPDLFVSGLL